MGLFVESINDVIDVHSLRLALRLPNSLGFVLFGATLLSFLLVGVASSSDGKRNIVAIFLFALAFVAVMVLIVDIDRPQQGLLTVSQQAMADLLRPMTLY